jgi:hypothetical protein
MPLEWAIDYLATDVMKGMRKAVVAVALAISGSVAQAWSDDYYECTRRDGSVEYSLYKCERGQEQRHIGGKDAPPAPGPAKERKRPLTPVPARTEPRASLDGKLNPELNLATYKCVGKSGDILYTDASDHLAFEVYRCTKVTRGVACAETRAMLTRDPLAMVSNKLQCD